MYVQITCRFQWPRILRRGSAAARLLGLWVRIPRGARMFFCCECWVLSGRGLCDKLITRPEESYRLWNVVVCDPETSWMMGPWPTGGCRAKIKNKEKKTTHITYNNFRVRSVMNRQRVLKTIWLTVRTFNLEMYIFWGILNTQYVWYACSTYIRYKQYYQLRSAKSIRSN
jgi:hypothetical protein